MLIQNLCLGMVQTNCYILQNEETKEVLIIDPADNEKAIESRVDKLGGKPVAILLTHGHFDHIMACEAVAKKYNVPVIAYSDEKELLADPMLNHSAMHTHPCSIKADIWVNDNDEPKVPGFKFRVLHTPGHTAGSCCYYFYEDNILISGDTLFYRSCGRTDFATSSPSDMMKSLNRLMTELPDETYVYPGHEMPTTIGDEKRFNPFV